MTKGFVYDDGGRAAAGFKGSAGDCVARAVAIASGRPYAEVYAKLSKGMGAQRKSKGATARNGVSTKRKWFREYMASLGFSWTPTMQVGSGCKVHLEASELPSGRIVCAVSKHYTALIDGVVHDTHDPRRGGKNGGWSIYTVPAGSPAPVKGARFLRTTESGCSDQWAKADSGRCVYGYWTRAFP